MAESSVEILLVEDNPTDVRLTLRALRRHQLASRIEVVRDGVEALAFLFGNDGERPPPDLPKVILLDLKLPRLDGLEVLRRIRANARTRAVPVVMLTSSREERDLVASYALGVNSYVVKPVDIDQLTEAVRQLGSYWLAFNEPPPPSTNS